MLPNFKLVLRPNNQVTITRQAVIAKRKRYESVNSTLSLSADKIDDYVRQNAERNSLKTAYSHTLKHQYTLQPDRVLPVPLDLINRFQHARKNETRQKLGYGKRPKIKYFGHKSGQKIRETGAIIDRLCLGNPEKCRVVTLTLPSSEISAFQAVSNYSAYAVNRLFQIVRRGYPDAHWFYVYEHQKRGALHLHICIYHSELEIGKEISEKLCNKWVDILKDISELSGINLLFSKGFNRTCEAHEVQVDNQAMRLGCGAYFSKYASKNSGKNSDDINSINARKYPPCSFWGRSRELCKMCEEHSFRFSFESGADFEADEMELEIKEILSHLKIVQNHSFAFKKEIELPVNCGSGKLTVCEGFSEVFYLNPSDYKALLIHVRYLYKDRKTCNIIERSKCSMSHTTIYDKLIEEDQIF